MQTYEVWDIVPGRIIQGSVEGVIDDWEGFRVLIRDWDTDRVVRIAFASHVAYQNRDESDFVGEGLRSEGLGRGCFYRVLQSEFAARFKADSLRNFKDLKHFAIVTDADCIDVLATDEPLIEQL